MASVPLGTSSVPWRSPSLSSDSVPWTTWNGCVEFGSMTFAFGSTGTITTSSSVS